MAMENLAQQLAAVHPQLGTLLLESPGLFSLLLLAIIWKLVWYAIAMYKSGVRKQKAWFVILFICTLFLNDLGILAILYLIFNREKKQKKSSKNPVRKKK